MARILVFIFFKNRAILIFKNTVTENLSRKILNRINSKLKTYLNINNINFIFNYLVKYLTIIKLVNLFLYELTLKKNVIIVRNMVL